jgi:hypothetical protein
MNPKTSTKIQDNTIILTPEEKHQLISFFEILIEIDMRQQEKNELDKSKSKKQLLFIQQTIIGV